MTYYASSAWDSLHHSLGTSEAGSGK